MRDSPTNPREESEDLHLVQRVKRQGVGRKVLVSRDVLETISQKGLKIDLSVARLPVALHDKKQNARR